MTNLTALYVIDSDVTLKISLEGVIALSLLRELIGGNSYLPGLVGLKITWSLGGRLEVLLPKLKVLLPPES